MAMVLLPLTSPQATREEQPMAVTRLDPANDVRAFVYQWLHWFDVHADETLFLAHLAPDGLELRYPEITLRTHAEFVTWYRGIGKGIKSNTHQLSALEVEAVGKDAYQVKLRVLWRATTSKGKELSVPVRQEWQVLRVAKRLVLKNLMAEVIPE